MALLAAAALFTIYFVNVAFGAFVGTPFFGDVAEMLLLGAASVCFVIAILKEEADAKIRTED
ncbi:MAG: hypothetical protein HUJ27_02895 [Rhodobacteraceae bacterium]|nr:hypothetical protein [Paracoccaceae bacterium]